MSTEPKVPRTEKHSGAMAGRFERVAPIAIFPALTVVIFFLAAGRLHWTWAWIYLGLHVANALVVGPVALRAKPEDVAERGEVKMTETWDLGSFVYLLAMYLALPMVAGLDVRFGWTGDLSVVWHVAGAAELSAALGLASWATLTNAYMWSEVPVQLGQTVCSTGPYRFVRHPAYAGFILQALGIPIVLGSIWAMIPGVVAAGYGVIATSTEDRTLQAALPGYRDYVRRVRFRLVPGLW
jgi:protein-S-isoprenylcysteine O-methyltransferase Ste14